MFTVLEACSSRYIHIDSNRPVWDHVKMLLQPTAACSPTFRGGLQRRRSLEHIPRMLASASLFTPGFRILTFTEHLTGGEQS